MKEEGEITDDDDQSAVIIAEMTVSEKEPRRRVFGRRRKRPGDPDRHTVISRNDIQRSYSGRKSRDRGVNSTRSTTVPAVMELSAPAIKNTKPDFKASLNTCTSVTSSSTYFRPSLRPQCPRPQSRSLCPPHLKVGKNIGVDREFQEKSSHILNDQALASYEVIDSDDMDVITIDDSDKDGSVDIEVDELKLDDEDLDELQLRRAALDSAVKSTKIQKKVCTSLGEDSVSLSHSERLHSDRIDVLSFSSIHNLPDPHLDRHNTAVQPSVERNLYPGDRTGVCGVDSPLKACSSENYTLSALIQQDNAELHASKLTDSTCTNPVAVREPALPVDQDIQHSDCDNYDAVEMDLDSGNDSDSHIVSSFEPLSQPSEWTLSVPDLNFHQNECTPVLSSESSAVTTYSEPLLKSQGNLFDDAISQSSQPSPAASDSSNVAMNQTSSAIVCDDKLPVVLDTKTEVVNSHSFDNLQPQRKANDEDKKSELLLRAAVLQSLSSKRQQQQQQSQTDTASYASQDRVKAVKLQAATHSTKRTITPTSSASNQMSVQLPVHQPVVISLTGESSDSDDEQEPETVNSCDRSTVVSDISVRMSSNVDRVLREIRRATEGPVPEDRDIPAPYQTETACAVKYQEKPNASEPVLEKQYAVSNSACSLQLSAHNQTLLMQKPVMSKGVGDTSQLDVKDKSLQKLALYNLEREKRKLQQQKIALSKTKLKMARKKEQVDTAEKRVRTLREQLVAAEKIAISSKKQLSNLREETLALSHGIEQHQKAVYRLEVGLRNAQKNLLSSVSENGRDSENFRLSDILSAHRQSPDVKISLKWRHNMVKGTASFSESSVVTRQNSVRSIATADVTDRTLSTSQTFGSSSSRLCNTKQTQLDDSALMNLEAKMSHELKRLRHSDATEADKSESDVALVNDIFVKREPPSEAECNEVECSIASEQQIVSDAVKSAVSQCSNLNVCTEIKPRISDVKPNMLTLQKTVETSIDRTGPAHISSASFTMPSEQKIKQILHHYNISLDRNSSLCSSAPFSQLFISDPMFSYKFPDSKTSPVTVSSVAADSKSDALMIENPYKPYHSSLLCFRSYRCSDFYRQKGLSVSTETFSHKLDCHVPLCQFDLMGKCLDESCPLQHHSDYSLSKREQLVDIVSYFPSVAGIDTSLPVTKHEQLLNQYVEKFLKDTCVQMSHLEQCRCLIDRVKAAAGLPYPHAVCTSARCWKLQRRKQRFVAGDRHDFLLNADDVSEIREHESAATEDIRYWMVAESDRIKDLEEAVTATPSDDSLWIKLAYAKMMERKWCASHDECISYGLNVLARAVEANPSNSTLWMQYLDLYMVRSQADKDVSSLYEQAIQYAPSYEFFWKYLQLPVSYLQKMEICKRLRQYLCSPRCRDDPHKRSHHLLEIVLYQAALCTMSGRFKDGLQVIQAIVQSKASVIWLTLTSCDRIVLWLSFIHLYECRQLPETLFDPANSNPGPVVQKVAFVVPFRIGTKTRISYETLLQLFQCAFSACYKDIKPGSDFDDDEYLIWLAALHRSRILLELSCHGWLAARQLAEQVLNQHPYLMDVWLLLVQLILASRDNTTADKAASICSTVEKAVVSNPHSVTLFLAGTCALIECGETDSALNFAERCPISLFEVDQLDSTSVDPNLLYCCLLGQPVPLNYKTPPLRSDVSRQYVTDQQANLWLSYCLLLDLQGAHDQATETYHTALSCLTRTKDVRRLWFAFLRRTKAVISRQLPWLKLADSSDQKRKLWHQFESDVGQALACLPVRCSLPHSSQMWDDYTFHNEIIQLHVSCLSDSDSVQVLYEKYVSQMPGNVKLVLTSVGYLLGRNAEQLGHGLCLVALHSCPRSSLLWNLSLRLSQRTASVGLMRSLYAKATRILPFSASLWRSYVMFEVVSKSREHVEEVLEKCRRLEVNVGGFVDSLLK